MPDKITALKLSLINSFMSEDKIADKILECNKNTEQYGLILTEQHCRVPRLPHLKNRGALNSATA